VTVIVAAAVRRPVGVVTVAITCPFPIRPDAAYVVEGPLVGASVPGVPGASVQAADREGIGFPNASTPTALNDAVAPRGSVVAAGSIARETAGAPETVSDCVPATAPAARAVRVAVPEVVSW